MSKECLNDGEKDDKKTSLRKQAPYYRLASRYRIHNKVKLIDASVKLAIGNYCIIACDIISCFLWMIGF